MKNFSKTLLASVITLSSAGASAAAFQLAEVSTSGLGMAYAGNAAVADNASVVASNPALMTLFKQTEISAGGVVVNADVNVDGNLGPYKASQKNIIPTALVPNLYIVSPINDRFAIGGGVNVNYGMKSHFDPDFNAGMYGGNTELKVINFNLSGAYNLGYGFSAGAGLNVLYSEAEFIRHLGIGGKVLASRLAPIMPTAAASLAQMQNNTEVARVKGDEWSLGWNAGLMYEINERNRLGVAYHSAVNVKFKGQYSNGFPTAFNALLANPAIAAQSPMSQATGGQEIPGRLTLHLPAYWEISGYHKLTDKLAMQYSYKRTEWEKFKALTAYGESGNVLLNKEENYSDSSRVALGFSYDVNESLTLRTGIAYDETASVTSPSISIPDTDRTWYSVGATYRFTPNLSADLGYSHLRGSKNQFKEGNAVFNVKSRANLYGLNVNYKF
ncbi:TPA: outer membrane protein transport protein [Mannheimia haemolytica]